jgi:DNA-binding NarL/FixJ family response regulator
VSKQPTKSEKPAVTKKKVLLVDDHALMRQGLELLVNQQPDLEVCAQAETVHQAMEAIKANPPDIVVTDITLKESNGIELIKDARIHWPNLLIVVLTMHNETFYAERVLRAGARGFVTKSEPPGNVLAAIRAVLAGQIHVSEKLASQMIGKLTGKGMEPGGLLLDKLSDREFEVFELIGQGMEIRLIASQLHLSIKTVETHRDNIRKKLDLDSSTDLLKYALQWFQYEGGT